MKIIVALNAALEMHRRDHPDAKADVENANRDADNDVLRTTGVTAAQRADAFVDAIITPMLQSGTLPTCGGVAPTICVVVPLDRLADPAAIAAQGDVKERLQSQTLRHSAARLFAPNGPGEMLISGTKAQQLSCDATVQRVVMSPAGKPLDIGRRTRVIPEQIRAALVVRDGGCVFPFCDRPAGWAEGHHVKHWSRGGSTSLDNLVLLCSKHHHQVHSDHIPIEFDETGLPHVRVALRLRR